MTFCDGCAAGLREAAGAVLVDLVPKGPGSRERGIGAAIETIGEASVNDSTNGAKISLRRLEFDFLSNDYLAGYAPRTALGETFLQAAISDGTRPRLSDGFSE